MAYPTEPVVLVNELEGDVLPSLEAFVIDNCDTNADYEVTESVLGEEDGVLTLERVHGLRCMRQHHGVCPNHHRDPCI